MRHLLLSLPFALVACSSVTGDDPASTAETLALSYGGADETDEAPAFGDAELTATEDTPAGDTITDGLPDLARARRVPILIVWGYLRPHPDATETVDWTGTITVENAALRIVRKIHFEDPDVVLSPRTDIKTVEFESHTKLRADGLLVEVILAPALNPVNGQVTLSFNTAPFTDSLVIEPGMRLAQVRPVDDAGHVVAYHVIRPDGDGCREGFVRGVWRATGEVEGRQVGELKGRITGGDGTIRGHLRGVFGERRNGHQVWFAKVVGTDGAFAGVAAGRYGDGKLAGLFLGRGRVVIGSIRGEYRDGDGDADGGFMGRWSERCGEDPREGQPSDGDEPEVDLVDPAPPE